VSSRYVCCFPREDRKAVEEQRRRVDDALAQLERERSRAATPGTGAAQEMTPAVSAPPEKGQGPRLDLYGFAQLDAIYDVKRVDPNWKATLRPSKIPVDCPGDSGCGKDGETTLSVRQSRFGVKGFLPTPLGELLTKFEFDLFATGSDAGETNFRLRHAYGELGPVLAGQTNSVFMDGDVFPDTIDYWGPAGMVFFRNPQLRYTPVKNDGLEFAVALESPSSAIDEGKIDEIAPELNVQAWNPYPDFTTHLRFSANWGHVQAAGIVRGLGFQTTNAPGSNPSGTEIGWGFNLSSAIRTIGEDQLLLEVTYGRGIASYMNDGGSDLAPSDSTNPDAEALPILGWLAYYNRTWNEKWTSSVGFSETRQWTTSGQTGTAFETGQYFSANLLYHPLPQMLIGPEFLWGRREDRDHSDQPDSRVQLSFKYDFGASIGGER
jgi:hypothetical protein